MPKEGHQWLNLIWIKINCRAPRRGRRPFGLPDSRRDSPYGGYAGPIVAGWTPVEEGGSGLRYRLAGVFMILAGALAGAPSAPHAEATRPQCECDHDARGDREHAAEVANAAACFLTENENRHWCSFDVAALEGSVAQAEFLLTLRDGAWSGQPGAIAILGDKVRAYLEQPALAARLEERFAMTADDAVAQVRARLDGNSELLAACLDAFVDRKPGDFVEMQPGDGAACGVHPETGWLNLELRLDGFRLLYLTEPPRG